MLHLKSKKITLPLCFCVVSILLTPAVVSAASGTGDVAALRATEQKAALAAKKAQQEAKKAAEKQLPATLAPTEEKKEVTEVPPVPAVEKKEK